MSCFDQVNALSQSGQSFNTPRIGHSKLMRNERRS